MANHTVQVLKIDPEVHRTLKALTRAIDRQTNVLIEIEQDRKKREVALVQNFSGTIVSGDEESGLEPEEGLVHMPTEEELDEEIKREAGLDIDQRMREEAVAEGDNIDILQRPGYFFCEKCGRNHSHVIPCDKVDPPT